MTIAMRPARRLVLSTALLGGSLAAYIAAVYVAVVVLIGSAIGAGTRSGWLTLTATVAVAVTFDRVRELTRRVLHRLLFGERATPVDVLAQFSTGVAETGTGSDALTRMAHVVADGTGAMRAEVWLNDGGADVLAASFPEAAASTMRPEGDLVEQVIHQGERLGALAITKHPGDPVTPAEARLLHDVASQAGLALRNVRLTEELSRRIDEIAARSEEIRASRRRVVVAHDTERRRLERDIHDGAQQHLVALAIKLRLARSLAEKRPGDASALFGEIRDVADEAIETLHHLTRGIYPPVLSEHGIAAALAVRAERSPTPVSVESVGVRRYPLAIEAAVYFTCLEAIQNAVKYAGARRITTRLEGTERGITFSVADDGVGFEVEAVSGGSGLQNLADRLAAVGGTLRVTSAPGSGTVVAGEVPSPAAEDE